MLLLMSSLVSQRSNLWRQGASTALWDFAVVVVLIICQVVNHVDLTRSVNIDDIDDQQCFAHF